MNKPQQLLQPANLDFLLACFDVSQINKGIIRWRERPRHHFKSDASHRSWNRNHVGKYVGRWDHGHRQVGVTHPTLGRVLVLEHRLVWLLTHGEAPPPIIDHINRVPFDNRPSNLRAVTQAENFKNSIRYGDSEGRVELTDDGRFEAVFQPREGASWSLVFDDKLTAQAAVNYLSFLYEDAFDLVS